MRSGNRKIYRLPLRGSRRVSHAIHIIAITQVRYRHSGGRACYDQKTAQAKTHKQALRSLKRPIRNAIYARLQADARQATAKAPRGQPGNDPDSRAASSHPERLIWAGPRGRSMLMPGVWPKYLEACERNGVDPVVATRAEVAAFVREPRTRPSCRGVNVVVMDSAAGLANATMQQRLVPVRLFYDLLVEEGLRASNPVGRGRYTPGGASVPAAGASAL